MNTGTKTAQAAATRREFLKRAACGAAALCSAPAIMHSAAPAVAAAGGGPQERPNIILCMSDDQGWGDTSYNGHKVLKTPELDAMAASGLRFNRFYAAHPQCSPTRGSVLTGRHPNRYGCFQANMSIRPEEVTIGKVLKAAGYTTGHFGKWHVGPVKAGSPLSPVNCGFDESLSHDNWFDLDPPLSRSGGPPQPFEGEPCEIVTDAALEFIRRQAAAKRPFLALLWFPNPHEPCRAAEKYKEPYKHLPEREQNYYGEVAALDAGVGKLRKALRDLGIADNTLLWFNSDNGPYINDPGSTGGLRGWKVTLWEGGIRVPGIIEWPARIKRPMVTDVPCSTCDIYPTIIDILGLKVPGQVEPIDGISLAPLLEGRMTERPKPIGFWWNPRYSVTGPYLDADALTGTWRTFQNHRYQGPRRPNAGNEKAHQNEHAALVDNRYKLHKLADGHLELYDLAADPAETKDLAQEKPEVVRSMAAALDAWQLSVERSLMGQDYPTRTGG